MNTENDYVSLGYYICKYESTSGYLSEISEKMISVSECLCIHEPQIFLCHGWKPKGDNEEYRCKCNLNKEQYLEMSSEITNLCSDEKYIPDGRFLNISDAKYFYKKYFDNPQHILVSVITKSCYLNALDENFKMGKIMHDGKGELIGCDIIGWDISGFHSFLCNSLRDKFEHIKFNSYGLLDIKYIAVEEMAFKIKGMGEPVDWIPVMIRRVV